MAWARYKTLVLAGLVAPLLTAGCVQPYVYDRMKQRYQYDKDFKTPVMPPLQDGYPEPKCEDPPTDQEILRVMNNKRIRGVPYVYEEFHDDVTITKERLVDKIDPPRFLPLVGWVQIHHCHWQCAVYYTETIQSAEPYSVYIKKPRVQVFYIDKDHPHMYVGPNADTQRDVLLETTKIN